MALTDISTVEDYLGVTLDSAEIAVYSQIIDAVDAFISCYCDTAFDDAIYKERLHITDGQFNLRNNNQYFYTVNVGIDELIDVTGTSLLQSINIEGSTLSLISTFSKVDIDFSGMDLNALVTAIDAEAGWSAELNASADNTYALVLYEGSYALDDNFEVSLIGAGEKSSGSRLSNRLYQSSVECGEGVAIYQGGYATIPADLKDAATRFVIEAYDSKNPTTVTGELKSEKIGDYAYTVMTASELSTTLTSVAVNYYGVLDCYKNFSI